METVITSLLTGELGVTTLLLLFILGILTKRFVPWWVYEEVVEELRKYEEDAPDLTHKVDALISEVRSQGYQSEKLEEADKTMRYVREQIGDTNTQRRRRYER